MADYIFHPGGHFFDQVSTLAIVMIADVSPCQLYEIRKEAAQLPEELSLSRVEHALRTGVPITVKLTTDLPLGVGSAGKVVIGSILKGIQELTSNPSEFGTKELHFSEVTVAPSINEVIPGPGTHHVLSAAQMCVGSAFETVKPKLRAHYGGFRAWPPALQYFKHIRDACFHGNCFNIQQPIYPSSLPHWRSSYIPSREAMDGKTLFEEFLGIGDVPVLLADIASQIEADSIAP